MSMYVLKAKNCVLIGRIRPSDHGAIEPVPKTAIIAHSKPNVRRASKGAASAAVSMKPVWNGYVPISIPSPTRRPCVSGRSGSSLYCRGQRLAWHETFPFAAARAASTVRPCGSRLVKISNACSRNGDGDDGRSQSRRYVPLFGECVIYSSFCWSRGGFWCPLVQFPQD
jgi:hypothetical protein